MGRYRRGEENHDKAGPGEARNVESRGSERNEEQVGQGKAKEMRGGLDPARRENKEVGPTRKGEEMR